MTGITDSSSQHQKTEASQKADSEIFANGKQQLPREFQKHLSWRRTKLDRTGGIEVVEHFVSGIRQRPQRRLLAEVVEVRIHLSSFDEPVLAE